MEDAMHWQVEPVYTDTGKHIGSVQRVELGRHRNTFWQARALDNVDLGLHPNRVEAEWCIQDDNEAGCPRSPRNIRERWRPIYDDAPPVYLSQ
jgi:hypothetical protein